MKIAFQLPTTEMIQVDYITGGVLYKKIMKNPRDNGLLAIALSRQKVEMKQVKDVREFAPLVPNPRG